MPAGPLHCGVLAGRARLMHEDGDRRRSIVDAAHRACGRAPSRGAAPEPSMTNVDPAPRSDFLRVLGERGYIHQCSDTAGLDALAAKGEIVCYVGYDCTAPSLHVGHLLSIMMLHWLQTTGAGKPITLMGGGTTRVGDPSGRDETRRILPIETIEANKDGIKAVFSRFLTFGAGKREAIMVDNAEWLAPLNYIEFLRDVGRHFSVNRMLSMDSAKMRLEREQELSFIEFNYMLLQSYDYVELARRYGCNLQMGGSDQWGNIVSGIDLGRRMGTHQLYALTCPLLTTSSGAKMGKTAAGAVWLNEDQLSAYDYWQFWRNTEDGDVGRFLKLFTTLPLGEVARLAALAGAEINDAKKVLATEATALVHGRDKAEAAAETARRTFEQGALDEGLPTIEVPRSDIENELGVLAAFVTAGLVKSNSEARKAVANASLSVNDQRVTSDKAKLRLGDVNADGFIKLSLGKKRHVLLKPVV
jgi:tyrosyl-tRNA synthetase